MVDVTTEDGMHVRIASWTDKRNRRNDHRMETHVGPDRLATFRGDRFIAEFTEQTDLRSSSDRHLAFVCMGQLEFIPMDDGKTEVDSTHNHSLTGGNWLQRQQLWKSDVERQPRTYRERCESCEAELRSRR
jgi:hypothetical protein